MSTEPAPNVPAGLVPAYPIIKDAVTGNAVKPTNNKQPGAHHYLVCIDVADSQASQAALTYVKERLAREGDLVILLTVLPNSVMDPGGAFLASMAVGVNEPSEWYFDMEKKRYQLEREKVLENLRVSAQDFAQGVHVHVRLAYGDAVTEILESAQVHQCDMVIVGRRKMGKFKRWLSSGSVSTALLTNSEVSVLVVR